MNEEILSQQLERYLAVRAALRSPLRDVGLLKGFVRCAGTALTEGRPLGSQLAVEWACSSPRARAAGRARRLVLVRGFLAYVRASFPSTEVPPPGLLPRSRARRPYIFSEQEIVTLQRVALDLVPRTGLRPATYVTLIGLLASCGLRIGEALRLPLSEVWLDGSPPVLVIRKSKFGKSRLVPLHPSTVSMVRAYIRLRHERLGRAAEDRLFVSDCQGRPLNASTVRATFRRTLFPRAQIRGALGGRGPEIHGLRHTFAVRRIEQWQRDGEDVRKLLPQLSVYMGHADPINTYWYLTLTPKMLCRAAESFERYASEGGSR